MATAENDILSLMHMDVYKRFDSSQKATFNDIVRQHARAYPAKVRAEVRELLGDEHAEVSRALGTSSIAEVLRRYQTSLPEEVVTLLEYHEIIYRELQQFSQPTTRHRQYAKRRYQRGRRFSRR